MKDISLTTVVGIARILIIMGCAAVYLTGSISLLNATASATALCGLLGGVGFVAAQDAGAQTVAKVTAHKTTRGAHIEIETPKEKEKK